MSQEVADECHVDPLILIEEIKKRPGLYDKQSQRSDRVELWKEVGAAVFTDWQDISKADTYDRVLELQRRWKSFRDQMNRELRIRNRRLSPGAKIRKPYLYFNRLRFLIKHLTRGNENELASEPDEPEEEDDPIAQRKVRKIVLRRMKRERSPPQEVDDPDSDSSPAGSPERTRCKASPGSERNEAGASGERLFLLSFVDELSRLPPHLRMWARTQISNVMQQAVSRSYESGGQDAPTIKLAPMSPNDDYILTD